MALVPTMRDPDGILGFGLAQPLLPVAVWGLTWKNVICLSVSLPSRYNEKKLKTYIINTYG